MEKWSRIDRFLLHPESLDKFKFKRWALPRTLPDHCPFSFGVCILSVLKLRKRLGMAKLFKVGLDQVYQETEMYERDSQSKE